MKAPLFKQRGDALIEGLVSIVLLSFIMIGLTFLVAKTAVAQKNTSVLNMALFSLRSAAQTQGVDSLCKAAAPSVQVADKNMLLKAQCSHSTITATVAGQTITVAGSTSSPITSAVLETQANKDNAALIGGDGVISFN